MTALKLAFDTVIVGTLALPWLIVFLDLFFGLSVGNLWAFLRSHADQFTTLLSLAAVVSFTIAYFVGIVVNRASGDFFNDEFPRSWPTEDNIRTAVYCNCELGQLSERDLDQIINKFHSQEAAVLLEGTDKAERLTQFHSQLLILRGAAFNGFLTAILLLFGWNRSLQHWLIRLIIPVLPVATGIYFLYVHPHFNDLKNPPFMEAILILLGIAGLGALWKHNHEKKHEHDYQHVPKPVRSLVVFALAALLTVIAFFGWWWSEVLYDEQVNYSYYALMHNRPEARAVASVE